MPDHTLPVIPEIAGYSPADNVKASNVFRCEVCRLIRERIKVLLRIL